MKRKGHNKNFYQHDFYRKIKKYFKEEKYNNVIKEASVYLELFPNDINVRFMRAKSYRILELFEESINDLKYNLSIENNEYSLLELYFLYYYLNRYEDALDLLPLLYKSVNFNHYSLLISELVMKIQLGIDPNLKINSDRDYTMNQVFNYDINLAFEHVKNHLVREEGNYSNFNNNVNLEYLFNLIRENIKNSKKVNTLDVLEIYFFGISNIGCYKESNCNFLKVIVAPNTSNIISMYPMYNVDYSNINNIDCDYNKLFSKENEKVKSKSRIDKFNNRYKRV